MSPLAEAQQLELRVSGLHSPTAVVNWPGNPDLYVVAQRGLGVITVHDTLPGPGGALPPMATVLDLSSEARLPPTYCTQFIGITGLAFHPEFLNDVAKRFLFVRFNLASPMNKTVIRRYYVRTGTVAAQLASGVEVYSLATITDEHAIGQIHFAPSGPAILYFSTRDDASSSSTCDETVRAQDDLSDLGKVIGLAVDEVPIARTILAKGLRNPFGMSVDFGDSNGQGLGDIWISDTGTDI